MGVNTNKRIAIKWVRDKAKSAYDKKDKCFICGSTENLELHHTNSLTNLFEKWAKDTGTPIDTDDDVISCRDEFIRLHYDEIYIHVYTLCAEHHIKLHSVYTKSPPLATALKQVRWINLQKEKLHGNTSQQSEPNELVQKFGEKQSSAGNDNASGGIFSRFISKYNSFSSI